MAIRLLTAILLIGAARVCCDAQTAKTGLHQYERALASRLAFETLWDDLPKAFTFSASPITANLSLYMDSKYLFYCSYTFAVCAQYELSNGRIRDRLKSTSCRSDMAPCGSNQNEIGAVQRFANLDNRIANSSLPSRSTVQISGQLPQYSGIVWTMTMTLDTKESTLSRYRPLRPPQLSDLTNWIQGKLNMAGYSSVTIACFDDLDPSVYLYGERREKGGVVIEVSWNAEREDWVEAKIIENTNDSGLVSKLSRTIKSISCGDIRFP